MDGPDVTERFRAVVDRDPREVPLDEAALLIAARANPTLDVETELHRLDELAASCRLPTLDALVRHVFVDLGFAGNREGYYEPANSYLDEVVRRRVGIPISLAVLLISLGRRLGVPLTGVGMPGHFLVRDRVDPAVFVDPFEGAVIDRRGCVAAFARVHGTAEGFRDEFLEPVGAHAILVRMLANLRAIFSALADRPSITWVLELRAAIPGTATGDLEELGAAMAATGRFGDAARVFDELAAGAAADLADAYANRAQRLRARLN